MTHSPDDQPRDTPNPYEHSAPFESSMAAALPDSDAGPPRVWTVFVTMGTALFALLLFSTVAAIPFIVPIILENPGESPDPEALTEALTTPWAFFCQAFPGQLAILGAALGAAHFSPTPMRQRIGLVDSGLSTTQWLIVGVGAFAPAAFGLLLATGLSQIIAPDETAAKLFSEMPTAMIVPWVLFISLAPGFGEEILFRGYMQRRLLERWSPRLAIFVSSLLFAVFHIMPHTVVFAFPIGVWFGYIAWKTGSIWPTILGHALVNGVWNILNISYSALSYSDSTYNLLCLLLLGLGVIAFALSFSPIQRVAAKRAQESTRDDSVEVVDVVDAEVVRDEDEWPR